MDVLEAQGGPSINGACRCAGEPLGIHGDTLRRWLKRTSVDVGKQPAITTQDRTRSVGPEREVRRAWGPSARFTELVASAA